MGYEPQATRSEPKALVVDLDSGLFLLYSPAYDCRPLTALFVP